MRIRTGSRRRRGCTAPIPTGERPRWGTGGGIPVGENPRRHLTDPQGKDKQKSKPADPVPQEFTSLGRGRRPRKQVVPASDPQITDEKRQAPDPVIPARAPEPFFHHAPSRLFVSLTGNVVIYSIEDGRDWVFPDLSLFLRAKGTPGKTQPSL